MPGKYARKDPKQNKTKSVVIALILFLFLIISGITAYVISQNINDDTNNTETTVTSEVQDVTSIAEETTVIVTNSTESTDILTEPTTAEVEETTEDIVVPGAEDADESLNFSAEFTAYKAYDITEDRRVSLKEVFGSSYTGDAFVFSDEGTFQDNLISSAKNYGAYVVVDDVIRLTYANDKNSTAEIISQDDYYTPTEIMINYGGYEVYFKLNGDLNE